MQTSHSMRLQYTRQLMKWLSTVKSSEALPVQIENGERPVVVALLEDRISEVANRVERTGAANVVVCDENGFVVLSFLGPQPITSQTPETQVIHEDISMEMFLTSLRTLADERGALNVSIRFGGTDATVPQIKQLVDA